MMKHDMILVLVLGLCLAISSKLFLIETIEVKQLNK